MSELVSLREFSRRIGVGLRAVQWAIENSRIKVAKSEQHGQRTRVFLDYESAARDWEANRDPSKRNRPTKGEMKQQSPRAGAGIPVGDSPYQKARSAREVYNAKMAELKYKIETKMLVPVEDVKILFFDIARTVQQNMLNIPNRVSAIIAAEIDEKKIHDILLDEIAKSLEALSNGKLDKLTKQN